MSIRSYQNEAILLLKKLIATPAFSRQEAQRADLMADFLKEQEIPVEQKRNNLWVRNRHWSAGKPVLLLNSHLDTVKPNDGWTLDPFEPLTREGKLFGLGSNDAGGSLVSLLETFLYFYKRKALNFNLVFAATAEEENSGKNGIECILEELAPVDFAIVGEPTGMEMAVAEKGLMVLDCTARGTAGHAAREVGENAILNAIEDIRWFHSFRFPKESEFLGPVKMTVTMIQAGIQHNIIPDTCRFVVDVRSTDAYSNEEILQIVREQVKSEVAPRSTRLKPSKMEREHPLVRAAVALGIRLFGSPTTSDQAVLPCPSVKMGPGQSERSHTADEFIYLSEIESGIETYIRLLEKLNEVLGNQTNH